MLGGGLLRRRWIAVTWLAYASLGLLGVRTAQASLFCETLDDKEVAIGEASVFDNGDGSGTHGYANGYFDGGDQISISPGAVIGNLASSSHYVRFVVAGVINEGSTSACRNYVLRLELLQDVAVPLTCGGATSSIGVNTFTVNTCISPFGGNADTYQGFRNFGQWLGSPPQIITTDIRSREGTSEINTDTDACVAYVATGSGFCAAGP